MENRALNILLKLTSICKKSSIIIVEELSGRCYKWISKMFRELHRVTKGNGDKEKIN